MPHTDDGLIYKNGSTTPKQGISIKDIQEVLGNSRNDIGGLITYGGVNAFSKVHPQNVGHIAPPIVDGQTDERESTNYGLTIPEYTSASSLLNGEWSYNKGQWYRFDDFDNYYHYAPLVLTCPVTGTIVFNAVDETHNTAIPFYAFSLYGGSRSVNWLYNRELDEGSGEGSGDGAPSNRTTYCLSVESLKTNAGSSLIGGSNANTRAVFGVALFDSNNRLVDLGTTELGVPKNPVVCTSALRNNVTQSDNNMVLLPETRFSDIMGSYTAVPCIRLGNPIAEVGQTPIFTYVPLCKDPIGSGSHYPCRFTLNIGGVNLYKIVDVNVSDSNGVLTKHLYTSESTIYLHITVRNDSGKTSSTTPGTTPTHTLDYWLQNAHLQGSVVVRGQSASSSINRDTGLLTTYNRDSGFQIPDGGTTTIVYKLDRIWNVDPSVAPVGIDSGELDISQNLYFKTESADTKFQYGVAQPLITVTYQAYNQ